MQKIIKITEEKTLEEDDREIQRFIFSDDKIVKVDMGGNVLTKSVDQKYLNAISAYNAAVNANNTEPESKKDLRGIGGWLLLLCIGLLLGVLANFVTFISEMLIAARYPELAGLVAFESIFYITLITLAIISFYLICSYKKAAIKTFIALLAVGLVGNVAIALAVALYGVTDFPAGVIVSIIQMCIWVPYILTSARVKQTLIK
jgi:uncharacterized membrane protein